MQGLGGVSNRACARYTHRMAQDLAWTHFAIYHPSFSWECSGGKPLPTQALTSSSHVVSHGPFCVCSARNPMGADLEWGLWGLPEFTMMLGCLSNSGQDQPNLNQNLQAVWSIGVREGSHRICCTGVSDGACLKHCPVARCHSSWERIQWGLLTHPGWCFVPLPRYKGRGCGFLWKGDLKCGLGSPEGGALEPATPGDNAGADPCVNFFDYKAKH